MTLQRFDKRLLRGSTALLGFLLLAPAAQGGNGTFKSGVYSFCVSVRFNATAAQLANIQTAFQSANQVFADALDGQQHWGTINVSNNSGCAEPSEVWIYPGNGRPNGTLGQYGVRGQHVNIFYNGIGGGTDDFANPTSPGVAYMLAHQMAHHAFGLMDEYIGPSGAAHCARPPDTPDLNYSLMDNFFTRGGRAGSSGAFTLKEFCMRSNHDPDSGTYQTSVNHQSAWETIASHPKRAALMPAGLPNPAAPNVQSPNFQVPQSGLRVMVVIDHSGSMADDNKLVFAQQAASLFVGSLQIGDQVGVVSFDDNITVTYPLTLINNANTKAQIIAAINAIQLGGLTDIGDALSTGLQQIISTYPRSCDELILLLTDGDYNVGPDPTTVAPSIADQGVTVLTVGVGSLISDTGQAVLQSVATQTGGKYYGLSSAFGLVALFFQIWADTTGNGLLARTPLPLAPNVPQTASQLVEQGAQSVTFGISIANANANVTIGLKSPGGTVYNSDAAVTAAGGTVNRSISNAILYTFPMPQAGTWQITATSNVATNIEIFGGAVNTAVKLMVSTNVPSVEAPNPITIQATPEFGGLNITNVQVSGVVTRPDGSTAPVTLVDDGSAASGDAQAGDGIYSAKFSSFNASGTYTVQLTVSGTPLYAPGEAFGTAAGSPAPAPLFTRLGTGSFLVTGLDSCPTVTPISFNVPVNGVLSGSSCIKNYSYTDVYTFSGTAGQTISISMTSSAVDPYIFLIDPTGNTVAEDDNSGGGRNSRIPASGLFTLPIGGTYRVWATSSSGFDTGPYTLVVNSSGPVCSAGLSPTSQSFGSSGGNGTINVASSLNTCAWSVLNNLPWVTVQSSFTGSVGLSYTVAPNPGSARSGTITVAGQPFTITQSLAPPSASVASVVPAAGSASAHTFTFTFSDTNGWQALKVLNVLINDSLSGINACYVAFVPTSANGGTLYLVDNYGDAGGPYQALTVPGGDMVFNSQCLISAAGSSVTTSGNNLTLKLAINALAFAGNRVIYVAARDASANTDWQALGTWSVPGMSNPGPYVATVNPTHSGPPVPTYTFTFNDPNGWQAIKVANVLINKAITGVKACYTAYVPAGPNTGTIFLVDDAGNSAGPYQGVMIPGNGTAQNNQCLISAAGSSASASGNTLNLTMAITFKPGLSGNQVIYPAVRNDWQNSGWQAMGTITLP